jgi:hypothetical protein
MLAESAPRVTGTECPEWTALDGGRAPSCPADQARGGQMSLTAAPNVRMTKRVSRAGEGTRTPTSEDTGT